MDQELWQARKEAAGLRVALLEAHGQLLQRQYADAKAAFEALGPEWANPAPAGPDGA